MSEVNISFQFVKESFSLILTVFLRRHYVSVGITSLNALFHF